MMSCVTHDGCPTPIARPRETWWEADGLFSRSERIFRGIRLRVWLFFGPRGGRRWRFSVAGVECTTRRLRHMGNAQRAAEAAAVRP